jgi:hypothetical protein
LCDSHGAVDDCVDLRAADRLRVVPSVVQHYFTGEDTQAFLIVEVLKSDAITVSATDEHGKEIALDVPAIQQLVGANVKAKLSGSSTSAITYAGPAPVTFGFIVDEIDFDGTKWSLQGAAPSGGLAFGAGGPGAAEGPPPILLGAGCRVRI